MKVEACLLLIMNTMAIGFRRGPHHPHGQTPVERNHHHYKPKNSETLTSDEQLLHDTKNINDLVGMSYNDRSNVIFVKEIVRSSGDFLVASYCIPIMGRYYSKSAPQSSHIEEDSGVLTVEALSKMTPEELEFYYFSAHDFDKNSMLDGLEMLKSVYHTTEHEDEDPDADSSIEPEANDLDTYVALVDQTIASDDTDGDGYISYAEYRAARLKHSPERTSRILANKLK